MGRGSGRARDASSLRTPPDHGVSEEVEAEIDANRGTEQRRALILSYSEISTDPRVRRQVDWLTGDGWIVDTLGLGGHPAPEVRNHFVVSAPARWTTGRVGAMVIHLLLTRRTRFRRTVTDRIPREAVGRVRAGHYDLLVFNEYEFTPWVADRRVFTATARQGRLHLDIHEYSNPRARRRTLGGRLTSPYYRWVRRHIGHPAFTSRTAVNGPIGGIYADEFGIEAPTPVRNIPPYVDQAPAPVSDGEIRMLFHGMLSWQRGFNEIFEAMRALPERFSMTFMVMPNPSRIAQLQAEIDAHPARDRMRIVPPAPMRELAKRVNEYDLEIIFYRPLEENLQFALPNKFFEAIQGRLGLVVGDSPPMAEIVRSYGNGVVVPGFEASDLAASLAALTAEDVARFKEASNTAAMELNAEAEGRAFLAAIEGTRAGGVQA